MRLPSRTLHFNAGLSSGDSTFCATSRATAPCSTVGVTIDSDVLDLSSAGLLSGVSGLDQGHGLTVTPYVMGRFERSAAGPTERTTGRGGLDLS